MKFCNRSCGKKEVFIMTIIAYIIVFSILAVEAYPVIKAGFNKE